jgi:hypothetical protein
MPTASTTITKAKPRLNQPRTTKSPTDSFSTPIMEATDTTKAGAAEEVTISQEPATNTEVSAQNGVIQMPEQTAPKRRAPRVKLHPINANVARVHPPDGETKLWWSRLKSALGTTSSDFVNASLFQLQAAARLPGGGLSETAVNAALAMIEAAQPRDEIEGALAVQMSCTHTAAMAVIARLGNGYGGERRVRNVSMTLKHLLS